MYIHIISLSYRDETDFDCVVRYDSEDRYIFIERGSLDSAISVNVITGQPISHEKIVGCLHQLHFLLNTDLVFDELEYSFESIRFADDGCISEGYYIFIQIMLRGRLKRRFVLNFSNSL